MQVSVSLRGSVFGLRVALLACVVVLVGCMGDSGPAPVPTVPASGKLTQKGKPLVGYDVFFTPVDGGVRSFGKTDDQGKFVLGTNEPEDGAAVGAHKIHIVKPQEFEGESGREEFVPRSIQTSGLPAKFADPSTSGLQMDIPESGSDSLNIAI